MQIGRNESKQTQNLANFMFLLYNRLTLRETLDHLGNLCRGKLYTFSEAIGLESRQIFCVCWGFWPAYDEEMETTHPLVLQYVSVSVCSHNIDIIWTDFLEICLW